MKYEKEYGGLRVSDVGTSEPKYGKKYGGKRVVGVGGSGGGVTSWNGQTGDVIYIPPVISVNGQDGDVILDYSKLVRGSSNVLGPITVTNTLETILSSNIPMGDSRLFLTGTISRTGGSAAVGTLDVELYNDTVLLVGGTFEVFRDLNTIKQIVAPNSINLEVDTNLTLKMKYTGTGTVTVSNGTLSWDTVN